MLQPKDHMVEVNALDVIQAVTALIEAGMNSADFRQIANSPVAALRVAMAIRDCSDQTIECSPFEVMDNPVRLTEWARECVVRRNVCWVTVFRDELWWYIALFIQKPTFDKNRTEYANQEPLMILELEEKNAQQEFERILKCDFEEISIVPEELVVGQPITMTVLRFQHQK